MQKFIVLLFILLVCQHVHPNYCQSVKPDKILVIYLSRTNNTKAIAEIIHEFVGGDLVPLELVDPYPENYKAIVAQVARENETAYLPLLKTRVEMDQYNTIFIGFPTWGMQLPPPIKSLLNQYDLSGKTIIPFNTNAGYGVGSSFRTVMELAPDSKILKGFEIKGGVERDGIYLAIKGKRRIDASKEVASWLQEIGVVMTD